MIFINFERFAEWTSRILLTTVDTFFSVYFFFGRSSLFYFVSIDMYSRFREPLLRQLYKKKILNNLIVLYFY